MSMASSVVRERSDTLDDRVLGVTPLPLACALYIEGNLCDDHDDHGHMIGTAGKSTHTIAECFNWCNETAGCQVLTITFCHHLPLKRVAVPRTPWPICVPKALRHGLHAMLMLLLLSLLLSLYIYIYVSLCPYRYSASGLARLGGVYGTQASVHHENRPTRGIMSTQCHVTPGLLWLLKLLKCAVG